MARPRGGGGKLPLQPLEKGRGPSDLPAVPRVTLRSARGLEGSGLRARGSFALRTVRLGWQGSLRRLLTETLSIKCHVSETTQRG